MQLFSPYAALERHSQRQSATAAIVLDHETISYGDLPELVTSCANWLMRHEVEDGVNGDGRADFAVNVRNLTNNLHGLVKGDFVL